MGFLVSSSSCSIPISKLFILFLLCLASVSKCAASDYKTLVYKGCAKQSLVDPSGVYSQALSTLFGSLVSQSTKAKFFQTTSGSGQTTITGLFQCRGDLSNSDCYNCVSGLPVLSDKLCGRAIAARVQLYGCYLLYEVAGFAQVSGMEMLYKTCGGTNIAGSGFEEKRDTAFSNLENGVVSGHGFYTTSYQSMYVLAQCEGDVGDSDCGECVKSAVQRAQVECGSSISGQIYLHKCFISYNYYPNGAPYRSSSSPGSSYSSSSSSSSSQGYSSSSSSSSSQGYSSSTSGSGSGSGSGQNTGKTVAIILGGSVGVGFLVICLLCARNSMKKHDDF
ncbi:hypothetical protein SAY86_011154 [Trapa natans]|uniref:Gnk2-homologous domain-containing protein n=1 Tax=Trapa natans TaxID=22666 RepID=A0AAN7R4W6_TRANT|nr:hypothetical protein SAY86_011154 [Trapa natans]